MAEIIGYCTANVVDECPLFKLKKAVLEKGPYSCAAIRAKSNGRQTNELHTTLGIDFPIKCGAAIVITD